jgi:hypothetical protein
VHRAACVGEILSAKKKQETHKSSKLLASAENLVGMPDESRQTDNKREGEYSEQHQSRNVMTHKGVAKLPIPVNPMLNASHHQAPIRAAMSARHS